MYELSATEYKNLLLKDNTKTYKKATTRLEDVIKLEAKQISKGIKFDDKMECTVTNPAFITLKDHKTNFRTSAPCQLLNPCKSELRKRELADLLSLSQWKTQIWLYIGSVQSKINRNVHSFNCISWNFIPH